MKNFRPIAIAALIVGTVLGGSYAMNVDEQAATAPSATPIALTVSETTVPYAERYADEAAQQDPKCGLVLITRSAFEAERDAQDPRVLVWSDGQAPVGYSAEEDSVIYTSPYCAISAGTEF